MRFIDIRCVFCDTVVCDHFQAHADDPLPSCVAPVASTLDACDDEGESVCGGLMLRVYLPTKRNNVIGDDIPGGVLIKHALCNPDGSPRRYYSHSEINREAKKRGYDNHVEHIASPGSDKNRGGHTSRWSGSPTITEEERVRHWHETEAELQKELSACKS
jgi:hypothetical protein